MKLKDRNKVTVLSPFFYVLFLLPALVGCAMHQPQPIDLPVPVPESFTEPSKMVSKQAVEHKIPIARWWKSFNDPKLNALMKEAFSKNLDLAQAYARLDQLEAVYRTTRSAQLPSLGIEGQWSKENTPSFFGNNTGNSHIFSLAAGYELDLWQKLKSRTQAANLEMAASQEEIMVIYLTISAQLADNYYLAVEQRAQLELIDKTIDSFADTLARVEQRYREGLVSALDVYQAEQNLAIAKSQRPAFELSLAQAEHALAILLGHYPKHNSNMAGDLLKLPKAPAAFPAGLPSELLARRPDVEAALFRLKASDARIAVAIAERFPSFNLLGNYGTMSIVFSTGDIKGLFWKVLVDTAFPILDGGKRKAEVARTKAVFRENLAFYHKTVLDAFKEVEDALVSNRTTEERIASLQKRVEATGAAFHQTFQQYLQGLTDYLPVLAAKTVHLDAQRGVLAARRQLISDRISLARALGGDWMKQELKNVMQEKQKKKKGRKS